MFRLVLALDLMGGAVVHARRGERENYRPLKMTFTQFSSSTLQEVVKHYNLGEAYVADLDRITGTGENLAHVKKITETCKVMLDFGIRNGKDIDSLSELNLVPVLGSETCPYDRMKGAIELRECSVSIDFKDGGVLTADDGRGDIRKWAALLNNLPLREVLLLDLRRVGADEGPDLELVETVMNVTDHTLLVGGGVRGVDDLDSLENAGVAGVIVATAVHRGAIPVEMLAKSG